MQTAPTVDPAPRPWRVPLVAVAVAYVAGIVVGVATFFMMDFKSTSTAAFVLSYLTALIVAVLDTVGVIGGIIAIVQVRRSGSETGLGASIAATGLGLLGYVGVLALLINSVRYQYAPK